MHFVGKLISGQRMRVEIDISSWLTNYLQNLGKPFSIFSCSGTCSGCFDLF